MCMFCRSLFVLLYFFFWPLCCVTFFDIRTLITPLVSVVRLVPNFRSIRDRYTIRHHALYILHNRARHKMVWHQFETITPGTKTEEKCTFSYIFTIIRKFTEIQNFPFISSNIPAASAYGIYCYSSHKPGDKSWIRTRRILITINGTYPSSFMTHIL
jgi:hypothetical protein